MKNNFKNLEDLELKDVAFNAEGVKNGINSDMGLLRYISSIVEMYFPKVASLIVGLSGGNPEEENNRKKTDYPDMNDVK